MKTRLYFLLLLLIIATSSIMAQSKMQASLVARSYITKMVNKNYSDGKMLMSAGYLTSQMQEAAQNGSTLEEFYSSADPFDNIISALRYWMINPGGYKLYITGTTINNSNVEISFECYDSSGHHPYHDTDNDAQIAEIRYSGLVVMVAEQGKWRVDGVY